GSRQRLLRGRDALSGGLRPPAKRPHRPRSLQGCDPEGGRRPRVGLHGQRPDRFRGTVPGPGEGRLPRIRRARDPLARAGRPRGVHAPEHGGHEGPARAGGPGLSGEAPAPPPRRALFFIFAAVFLDLLGAGLLLPIIPYYVRQFDQDALTVGLLALSFAAAQFLATPALGLVSDRIGRRPVLIFSVLGSGLAYLV